MPHTADQDLGSHIHSLLLCPTTKHCPLFIHRMPFLLASSQSSKQGTEQESLGPQYSHQLIRHFLLPWGLLGPRMERLEHRQGSRPPIKYEVQREWCFFISLLSYDPAFSTLWWGSLPRPRCVKWKSLKVFIKSFPKTIIWLIRLKSGFKILFWMSESHDYSTCFLLLFLLL